MENRRYGFHPFGDPFERKRDMGHGDGYEGYKKKIGKTARDKNPRLRYKTYGPGRSPEDGSPEDGKQEGSLEIPETEGEGSDGDLNDYINDLINSGDL